MTVYRAVMDRTTKNNIITPEEMKIWSLNVGTTEIDAKTGIYGNGKIR